MRREGTRPAPGRRPLPQILAATMLAAACTETPTGPSRLQETQMPVAEGALSSPPFHHGVFLGDTESRPENVTRSLEAFASQTGQAPALVKTFFPIDADFSENGWAGRVIRRIGSAGTTNIVALDLRWDRAPSADLLSTLIFGHADSLLVGLARELASFRELILLEPGWEMNGDWSYPWQGVRNGRNDGGPERFVAAWRHVVSTFRSAGAGNVRWVFSPNIGNPVAGGGKGTSHWNWYGNYYPGDDWVDYVGIHGFHAPVLWGTPYQDFTTLFDGAYADHLLSDIANRFPAKPIIVSEFAAEETPGHDKGAWIRDAFRYLHGNPRVVGAVWFNMRKETDWRIDSSSSALAAYCTAVQHPRARSRFTEP